MKNVNVREVLVKIAKMTQIAGKSEEIVENESRKRRKKKRKIGATK